jgi:hypothetical protein
MVPRPKDKDPRVSGGLTGPYCHEFEKTLALFIGKSKPPAI